MICLKRLPNAALELPCSNMIRLVAGSALSEDVDEWQDADGREGLVVELAGSSGRSVRSRDGARRRIHLKVQYSSPFSGILKSRNNYIRHYTIPLAKNLFLCSLLYQHMSKLYKKNNESACNFTKRYILSLVRQTIYQAICWNMCIRPGQESEIKSVNLIKFSCNYIIPFKLKANPIGP